MRQKRIVTALVMAVQCFVLATVLLITNGNTKVQADTLNQITGTVTSQSGAAVGGTSVYATNAGGSTTAFGPVTTAPDGTYTLGVQAGTYDFHFDPPSSSGLDPSLDTNVTVLNDQTINIVLQPTHHTFSGRLTDSNGNPLAGFYIRLTTSSAGAAAGQSSTDSNGDFNVSAVPGTYYLDIQDEVATDNFEFSELAQNTPAIDLTSGNVTQDLQIPTTPIHVTVTDNNGNPLPNVAVRGQTHTGSPSLYAGDPGQANSRIYTTGTTDANGVAELTSLVGMTYTAGGTNHTDENICATISSTNVCLAQPLTIHGETSVTIAQPTLYTLSGRLTDSNGNPLPGFYMRLTISPSGASVGTSTTDSNGNFSTAALPGTYYLDIQNEVPIDNFEFSEMYQFTPAIDLTTGNVTQDMRINTAPLHVTVEDAAGNPLSGIAVNGQTGNANLSLYAGDPGEHARLYSTGTTDTSGVAELTTVIGAMYDTSFNNGICATIAGTKYCQAHLLTVNGETSVIIQIPPNAPTNLTAPSPTQAPALSWDAAAHATSYNIYRDGQKVGSSTNTSFTDVGAIPSTYQYYVTASNAAGAESAPSNSVSVTVFTVPSAPQHVLAVPGAGQVAVSWDAPTSDGGSPITSYTVTAVDVTTPANGGQTATSANTSVNVTGLTAGDRYYFTVVATNAAGNSAASPPSGIVLLGQAPAITSANSAVAGTGLPFSFIVTTTGAPTPTITENGTLPAGLIFANNGDGTASISGTPATTAAGVYTLTFTASNGVGADAVQTFTLTVNHTATAPTITSSNSATAIYGSPFNFTVTTTGYPAPSITKTGTLPAGITLTSHGDGTASISGTPTAVGTYTFTLTATNAQGSATQTFTLTVGKVPTISPIPASTARVGTPFSRTIQAFGTPTPTLTASPLPSGLTLTNNGNGSAVISGTPAVGSGGVYSVIVTATNIVGSATQTFTLTVNEAPSITSSNTATATIGTPFSFQFTALGYPDPTITPFPLGALPSGITYDSATHTLSGTPANGTAGTYFVIVIASNNVSTALQLFTLTVH